MQQVGKNLSDYEIKRFFNVRVYHEHYGKHVSTEDDDCFWKSDDPEKNLF